MTTQRFNWMAAVGLALCITGCVSASGGGEVAARQHAQTLQAKVTAEVDCTYLLYLPEAYEAGQRAWPLVLFLHGAGELGDDLELVKKWGPPRLVEEGKEFPFILVSPQCPEGDWWSGQEQILVLDALLDDVAARYRVDEDRVYVTGLSMGGFGTWRLALEFPDRFAAIVPICGKGEPLLAKRITHLPVWVFHGADAQTVPPQASEKMAEALRACGGNVKYTVYPNTGHNSWSETYANPEVYQWLMAQTRVKPGNRK